MTHIQNTCKIPKSELKSWFIKIPNKVPEWVQTVKIKSEGVLIGAFAKKSLNAH